MSTSAPRSRVLTGITTTGTPHLGNYVGAIRPAIAASRDPAVDAFFFMADYHALIKCEDADRIERSRLEIAASWLAAGLDPERVTFYRQSDIPEIPELTWLLTCVTAKGLMNRAHAYKAAVDANTEQGLDPDAGINMGLYSYPILMAADILMFNAHRVPVGRDQIQHIEMARDIAARFNHLFGNGREFFVLPEAAIEAQVSTLPGLDGRKMSKSYDNTVPLFEGGEVATRAAIMRIVTDSKAPGEPKQAEGSALFALYQAFAEPDESARFAEALQSGLAWGDAKQQLAARVERDLASMRQRYAELMAAPQQVEEILQDGAARARRIAAPLLAELREAVGLRRFRPTPVAAQDAASAASGTALPQFKQYREGAGFCFKLVAGDGRLLLQSPPFDAPKAAGQTIARLRRDGYSDADDGPLLAAGVEAAEVRQALAELAAAEQAKNAKAGKDA